LFANALVLKSTEARAIRMEAEPLGLFTDLVGSVPLMLIVLIVMVVILDVLHFGVRMVLADNSPQIPGWAWMLLVLVLAYAFSAVMTGIGGALLVTRLRASTFGGGTSILFQALVAVVIGGTSPYGKFGWFTGTVVAAIGIAALLNGLLLGGFEPYNQDLYLGALLILWLCLHGGIKLIIDYNKPATQPTDS
jgi:ribose/xylose/arabinose/galactoside ABC-type transport system permease subunit